MISPLMRCAMSTALEVLPDAVGPKITKRLVFFIFFISNED